MSASHPPEHMAYYRPEDYPWEAVSEKSRRKILRLEDHIYIAMIQWDAGYQPAKFDTHGGEETVLILDGHFTDGGPLLGPGSIVRGRAGSGHAAGTTDGCTFIVTRSLLPGEREKLNLSGSWTPPKSKL